MIEEPEAHCYDCPNSKNKGCAEFNSLNPGYLKMFGEPYDRGHCHWGNELIHNLATKTEESK